MSTRWERVARETAGDDYAQRYAERFRSMSERGEDVHGEAAFVADLLPAPARILDAGCGTGRIAVRLDELGYDVVGVDVDAAMLDVARAEAPALDWRQADLATFDLGETFDLVLLAGNVVPLLEPGALIDVCERVGAHLTPGGVVVCGFGLDAAHLPPGCPPTAPALVDAGFGVLGLDAVMRYGTWAGDAFDPDGGYLVVLYAEPRR
jgi:SAM-dependent methyltransferase